MLMGDGMKVRWVPLGQIASGFGHGQRGSQKRVQMLDSINSALGESDNW